MNKITLEFTEEEMQQLAEMSSVMMVLMKLNKNATLKREIKKHEALPTRLLEEASKVPALAKTMEKNEELGHYYFKEKYVDGALFSKVLNEMRETVFWEELVMRMAENTLLQMMPEKELRKISKLERCFRTQALEEAIKQEIALHGLDRLVFLIPENEQ